MLKILAGLVLGIAILLPAVAAFAGDGSGADRETIAAPVQIELNSASAQPYDVVPVENSHDRE